MPLPEINPTVDAASRVLFSNHEPASYNRYGACNGPGYRVDQGRDDQVRISHTMPDVDLTNDERPSDDELADERHRMVAQYAKTLEAAGWTVTRRGPRARRPYLLATRP
jgi:hypothetical protein